ARRQRHLPPINRIPCEQRGSTADCQHQGAGFVPARAQRIEREVMLDGYRQLAPLQPCGDQLFRKGHPAGDRDVEGWFGYGAPVERAAEGTYLSQRTGDRYSRQLELEGFALVTSARIAGHDRP